MACCTVATSGTRGCGPITSPLRLPPRTKILARARDPAPLLGRRHPLKLSQAHIQRSGFGISCALIVDYELLDDGGQVLQARVLLLRLQQRAGADLVEYGRRTLCVRWIDDG